MEKDTNLYELVTEALCQEQLDEAVNLIFQIAICDKKELLTPKVKSLKKECLEQLYILTEAYLDSNEVQEAEKLITAYLYLQEDERINTLKNICLQKKKQIDTVCIEQAEKTVQKCSSLKEEENKCHQINIVKYILLLLAVALILGGIIIGGFNSPTKRRQQDVVSIEKEAKDIMIDEGEIKKILSLLIVQWNNAHTRCDLSTLRSLYDYSDKIKFYGQYLTREQCVQKYLTIYKKLDGDFNHDIVSAITYSRTKDGEYRCNFVKSVTTKGKTQNYPSYLVFRTKNPGWYIVEESDEVTDRNLQKKSGNSMTNMNFVGKIDGKYKVTLNLVNDKGDVYGSYYYNKYDKNHTLKLHGTISGKQLQLNEYNEKGENTGFFDGKLDASRFYGIYTNYKGLKMDFDLSLI